MRPRTLRIGAAALILFILVLPLLVNGGIPGGYVELAARGRSLIQPPEILMIGDSITLGGSPWGSRLSNDPLSAVTDAHSGYTAKTLAPMTHPERWSFRPRFVAYMAGTNDAGDLATTEFGSTLDQLANIDRLIASGAKVIVTLAPPTSVPVRTQRVRRMNEMLRAELAKRPVTVIDMWPEMANGDVIRGEYTPDGLHFTAAGYALWAKHLRAAMQ
jgi:hypothetical protein